MRFMRVEIVIEEEGGISPLCFRNSGAPGHEDPSDEVV